MEEEEEVAGEGEGGGQGEVRKGRGRGVLHTYVQSLTLEMKWEPSCKRHPPSPTFLLHF